MTTDRDFDRIAAAWLDLMPDRAPDRVVEEVMEDVALTPQVRRPILGFPQTFTVQARFPLVAMLAIVGAVLLGAAMLLGIGGQRSTPAPPATSVPITTAAPLATDRRQSTGAPTAVATGNGVVATLRGQWIANAPQVPALGKTDPRIRLEISGAGDSAWISATNDGPLLLRSLVAGDPSDVSFLATSAGSGCKAGDAGHYQTTQTTDGLTLTLAAISDACAARRSVLARSWVRSLAGQSVGGRGVLDAFVPMILVTLPVEQYGADIFPDSAFLTGNSSGRIFTVVKNPVGLTDPCSASGGGRLPLQPGAAAFADYIGRLPGFTAVDRTDLNVDGHRAIHLAVTTAPTAECAADKVIEWTPKTPASGRVWFLSLGDPDSIYLVEVGTDLYLIQWLGAGVMTADELAVLSTVHFLDALPVAP
jgi:hypothetical protein